MSFDEGRALRGGVPIPVQCLLMRVSADTTSPAMHYHDYSELLFSIGGRARVLTGSGNYLLSEGDMILIHPHEAHAVAGDGTAGTYIVVKFLPAILLSGEQTLPEYGYVHLLGERVPGAQVFFPAEELHAMPLRALFERLLTEYEEQRFGYELSLRADITRVFLHILRIWQAKGLPLLSKETEAHGPLLRRALTYVQEHYAESDETAAAAACGVSRTYFSRVFKRVMHLSFTEYVNGVRLREAARMLLTGQDSVTTIAQAVGFSTSSYFIECFRRAYRETPQKYRAARRESVAQAPTRVS